MTDLMQLFPRIIDKKRQRVDRRLVLSCDLSGAEMCLVIMLIALDRFLVVLVAGFVLFLAVRSEEAP